MAIRYGRVRLFWFDLAWTVEPVYRGLSFWRYLKSLWHPRLTFKEIEELYRPLPGRRGKDLPIGEMYAALSEEGGELVEWMPPAFRGEQSPWVMPTTEDEVKKAIAAMPDWSRLSDEELAEKLKTARLGSGLIAEAGVRAMRSGEFNKEA